MTLEPPVTKSEREEVMIEADAPACQETPGGPAGLRGAGARRAWTGLLLLYLVGTLPLLVRGVLQAGAGGWLLAAHLVALAWVAAVRGRWPSGRWAAVGDWTVPLVLPLLYWELPLLMLGMPGTLRYHDAAMIRVEEVLFGGQPAFEWASALPVPWISEALHLGYLLYYPLIYVPPALLWLGLTGPREPDRREVAFQGTVLALGVAIVGSFAIMVVWPVQGPRYLGTPASVPTGAFRSVTLAILEAGSSRGAAFPSSHVAVATAQAALALRWQPRTGGVVAFLALLLALGAVYGGFHYLVDVGAGAVVGVLAAAVALAPWGSGRWRNPA